MLIEYLLKLDKANLIYCLAILAYANWLVIGYNIILILSYLVYYGLKDNKR